MTPAPLSSQQTPAPSLFPPPYVPLERTSELQTRKTEDLQGLQPDWDALLDHTAPGNPALTWEWTWAFLRVYGPALGATPYLLVITRDQRPVGIAPFYRTTTGVGPLALRRLVLCPGGPAWTRQFPTDLDLLAAPGAARAVGQAVAAYLWQHRDEWDQLDIQGGRSDSPALAALHESLDALGLLATRRGALQCRHAALPATWEAYTQQLSKGYGKKVARYERAFAREGGGGLACSTDPGQVLADLDELVRLRLESWDRDEPHAFSDPRFVTFHKVLAPLLHQRGWLRLAFLHGRDGQRLAGAYLIQRRGQVCFYQQAWSTALEKQHGGSVLIAALLRHAIAEGAQRFDFGIDAPYKAHWAHETRGSERLRLYNSTLGGWALWAHDELRGLLGRVRRLRQRPPRKGG